MKRSKADSFSAYLEAKQRSKPNARDSGGISFMAFPDFVETLKSRHESNSLTLNSIQVPEFALLVTFGEQMSLTSRPK